MEPEPHDLVSSNDRAVEITDKKKWFISLLFIFFLLSSIVVTYFGFRFYLDYRTVTTKMQLASELVSESEYGSALANLQTLETNDIWIPGWIEDDYQKLKRNALQNRNSQAAYLRARSLSDDAPEEALTLLETIPDSYPEYDAVQMLLNEIASAKTREDEIVVKDHIKGDPDSKTRLTMYTDFQCPACSSFAPYIDEILSEHGDDIAFQFKHFPLSKIHEHAHQAAVAAEAAGQQGKFFEYHDILFAKQKDWSNSRDPMPLFVQYAEQLEIDTNTFLEHLDSTTLSDKVNEDFQQGRDLGITGTPTFYLNGERMSLTTYDDFIAQIANEID